VAVIAVQAKMTTEDLLTALEQLEPGEVERIARRLLYIQARRRAGNLSTREAELLQRIQQEKRSGFKERFDALNAKRRTFTLTTEEHDELLRLIEESEAFTVQRLEALGELAQLRHMTLPALMKQLGLKAPPIV
jgi:hypothetical protein